MPDIIGDVVIADDSRGSISKIRVSWLVRCLDHLHLIRMYRANCRQSDSPLEIHPDSFASVRIYQQSLPNNALCLRKMIHVYFFNSSPQLVGLRQ